MKDDTAQSLREIAARIDRILGEAQTAYTHEVNALIHENCSDPERIEHLLDGLLDFCFDPEMLGLYKRVCRHYFDINPEATADYVRFYRELWEDGEEESWPIHLKKGGISIPCNLSRGGKAVRFKRKAFL